MEKIPYCGDSACEYDTWRFHFGNAQMNASALSFLCTVDGVDGPLDGKFSVCKTNVHAHSYNMPVTVWINYKRASAKEVMTAHLLSC